MKCPDCGYVGYEENADPMDVQRGDTHVRGSKECLLTQERRKTAALLDALESLRDFQNGCPLESMRAEWEAANRVADVLLGRTSPSANRDLLRIGGNGVDTLAAAVAIRTLMDHAGIGGER